MENSKPETIKGSVDSVVYRNEENGFAVITLDFLGDPLTVVGELGNVEEGEELTLEGTYTYHPKFGRQFKAEYCERELPAEAADIQRYLASGVVKGIGPVIAKKMVAAFGDSTLEVIENEPERLLEIEGITKSKCRKITEAYKEVMGFRSLLIYFSKLGLSAVYGVRAWEKWKSSAMGYIESNPYIMCRPGIELSFMKAEEIASDKGIAGDDEKRLAAGIIYVLNENAEAGHTCLPEDRLISKCSGFLNVSAERLAEVISKETENENLYVYMKKNRPFIMLRAFHDAELYIARRLAIMKKLLFDNTVNFDEVINIAEEQNKITYAQRQREAINTALSCGYMVLTGGPGTGKTTTLNAIISLFEQQGEKVMICAPTGRAAKRISDLTGYEAKTIHRLLVMKSSNPEKMVFEHNESNPLECDVIIIDEMSMVDVMLFEALLKAVPITCKLIMVGDSDQLPSVGAGNVLRDIIESKVVPTVRLNEIFRQAQESTIITNAHRIVNGVMPDLSKKDSDFFFFQRLDFESLTELTVELCKTRLPNAYGYSPIDDIQVLSTTRKGPAGTVELNRRLQQEINTPSKDKSEIKHKLYTFRFGDKVMQTKNNYDITWKKEDEDGQGIFNGDIGIIIKINKLLDIITIDFDGRVCSYTQSMLDELELAYAITVHKSQGSEFDAVILPLLGGFDKLYFRNLFYTAVTRAKKLLIIAGSKNKVKQMVDNDRRTNRYTCLKAMLLEEAGESNDENAC